MTDVSGAFVVREGFLGGFINAYSNIKNVAARLPRTSNWKYDDEGPDWCEEPRAIMVASHYDSTLGSPGVSDALAPVRT